MDKRVRFLLLPLLFLSCCKLGYAADSRFDLIGPKIDVRVTRDGQTLPIATVPNLQPGDKLWIHPDLPASQSVHYLLICVFLRGNTNPPPEDWFFRIETWDPKVRAEGAFVTVPADAQQAVMFLAPETGGDFKTLKSAVRGRPGAFVRASQDLIEAGFEEARIEKYIASIRRVPPADTTALAKHSDLLARTLALKPNEACFKQPVDTQFTCLTQTGSQIVLDDGNGQTISNVLNGPTSDLISQASYTTAAGGGLYSAYVGAIVDVVRIMSNLHSAQYQYIPAISFPQDDAMNLRLNTPPSFHNPKSVLVIALPAVQSAVTPPLRPADPNEVTCLIKPSVVLPIEGAPLVFSTDFAHDLVLHLNTPPGAPSEPDIPLAPDAYYGGLVLQKDQQHHIPLHDATPLQAPPRPRRAQSLRESQPRSSPHRTAAQASTEAGAAYRRHPGPLGFRQLHRPHRPAAATSRHRLDHRPLRRRGQRAHLRPHRRPHRDAPAELNRLSLRPHHHGESQRARTRSRSPSSRSRNLISPTFSLSPFRSSTTSLPATCTSPSSSTISPSPTNSQPAPSPNPPPSPLLNSTRAIRPWSSPARGLARSKRSTSAILSSRPHPMPPTTPSLPTPPAPGTLHFDLPANAPAPPTHVGEHLTAAIALRDGRILSVPLVVSAPRPVIALLRKSSMPDSKTSNINLSDPDDLPLSSLFTFTLKSPDRFPRNGQIEIETLDGTLRTVLTLAPSGGLLLQDPHTIVATLDPLRSFGPSAFGALRMRAIYPVAATHHNEHHASETPTEAGTAAPRSPTPTPTILRPPPAIGCRW